MRDLMADLRAADPFRQGGGRPFRPADRARFLEALERALRDAVMPCDRSRLSAATRARKARSPSMARSEGGGDRHPDRPVAGLGRLRRGAATGRAR